MRPGQERPQPVPEHAALLPGRVRGAHPGEALPGPVLQGADLVLHRSGEVQGLPDLPEEVPLAGRSRAARSRSTSSTRRSATPAACASRSARRASTRWSRSRASRCRRPSPKRSGRSSERAGRHERASSCRSTARRSRRSEGMTVLEAARAAGISIPTLCHHDALEPFGGCRLCIVEVEARRLDPARRVLRLPGGGRPDRQDPVREDRPDPQDPAGAAAGPRPGLPAAAGAGRGVRRGPGPLRAGGLLLHPLRPVRPLLRRGQEGARGRASSTAASARRSASCRRSPPGSAPTARSASRSARRPTCRRPTSWSKRCPRGGRDGAPMAPRSRRGQSTSRPPAPWRCAG